MNACLTKFPRWWTISSSVVNHFRRILLVILILTTPLGVAQSVGTDQSSPQSSGQIALRSQAESLTLQILDLANRYQTTDVSQRDGIAAELQQIAAARQQLFSLLAEQNSKEFLRVSLPANLRANLPPTVQSLVEQETDVTGRLEVQVEDRQDGAQLHHFLDTATGRLTLHFATAAPTNLVTGSTVHVHGMRLNNTLTLECCSGTSSNLQVATAASLPPSFGNFHTLVIMVNFQDNPTAQPFTSADVQNVVFTQTSNWDLANSLQQTWLTGDVAGWFTIPVASSNCDTGSIASDGKAAAQASGYNLGNYDRFIYLMASNSGCSSWWGYATIGGSDVWVNGKYQFTTHIVAHEMGHNFGLYHAHTDDCGTAVLCSSGTLSEYGDWIDVMGKPFYSQDGHFDSFHKEQLGWLNSGAQPPITTVTSDGSYTLSPYETQDSNPKALKILQSSNSSENNYYYVEYRQAIGADSFLSGYSDILGGIVLHSASPSNANSSDLLDMTPTSPSSFNHPGLVVGKSYTDSIAGVSITPTAVSSTGATVQVTFASATCSSASPTVSISPTQSQYVTAGTSVKFTITVKDNDSSACSNASFDLGANIPTGWSDAWSNSMLTLSPAGSASVTLTVTSPAGAANGFYTIGVNATNASATNYASSVSGTYVISTPTATTLKVSIATNQSSYLPGQTVIVNATVLSGSSPSVGTTVSFAVSSPSGKMATLSGSTGSNGVASVTYKLNKKAAAGTYHATANDGNSSASTMFTVQ